MSVINVSELRGYRILSIDPGTTMLGVAVFEIDCTTEVLKLIHAASFRIDRLSMRYPQIVAVHGERVGKLHAVQESIYKMLITWQPDEVVSESPFLGRFPQAFAALVECFNSIRKALMTYDRSMPLKYMDPASIKVAVGVSGKSGDKSLMAKAIKGLPDLAIDPEVDVESLDEHGIDAVAAGYAQYWTYFPKQKK